MIQRTIRRSDRRSRRGHSRRGYSLTEALVAMVVMSVLAAMGVPRFQTSFEQSMANVAGANLRSIWSAQRLYWLEYRSYAQDLATLKSTDLIDPSLVTTTAPYSYSVTAFADGSGFTATAMRAGSSAWSGSFTIAAEGTFTGSVQRSDGSITIQPSFQ